MSRKTEARSGTTDWSDSNNRALLPLALLYVFRFP